VATVLQCRSNGKAAAVAVHNAIVSGVKKNTPATKGKRKQHHQQVMQGHHMAGVVAACCSIFSGQETSSGF